MVVTATVAPQASVVIAEAMKPQMVRATYCKWACIHPRNIVSVLTTLVMCIVFALEIDAPALGATWAMRGKAYPLTDIVCSERVYADAWRGFEEDTIPLWFAGVRSHGTMRYYLAKQFECFQLAKLMTVMPRLSGNS